MASALLPNYLLSNRKRLALSQDEVAFLLGKHGGDKVCLYESFKREPNLETALALEIIYQKPLRDLFGGLYERVEGEVRARAKVLTYRKALGRSKARSHRKRETFSRIAGI